jgi:flagellar hook-length control protein FliK
VPENELPDAEGINQEIVNPEMLNSDKINNTGTLNPEMLNPEKLSNTDALNPEMLNPEKLKANVSGLNSDKVIFGTEELKSENTADKALSLLRDISMPKNAPEELNNLLSKLTGQNIASDTDQSTLIKMAAETIEKALNSNDTKALRDLLGNNELKNLLSERLEAAWTIKPEDVADEKKVEELYQRIDRQLKGLAQALESEGATSQSAYKAVNNMSDNIDFLHQLNQMYAYVQLPIKLNQGNAHGDLYVYTNKKNLASKDGKVSALLHLDMEHLGPVDVYVSLENTKVNTKFYVQDDEMLDFLSEHMDILTQRLEKRGYNCSFGMQVRGEDEEKEGGVKTLLKQEGHVPLSQYAFDVRA